MIKHGTMLAVLIVLVIVAGSALVQAKPPLTTIEKEKAVPFKEKVAAPPGDSTIGEPPSDPGVHITVEPATYSGPCPVSMKINASITYSKTGSLVASFQLSNNTEIHVPLQFDEPGMKEIWRGFVVGDPGLPYPNSGWAVVKLHGPGGIVQSNKAYWNVTCGNPDLTVSDIVWKPKDPKNMNAPIEVGEWKVTYKNVGSGVSDLYQVETSCEGVAGSGPMGATPVCPWQFFNQLQAIGQNLHDLPVGATKYLEIISGNISERLGGGKYKITAVAKQLGNAKDFNAANNKKEILINVPFATLTDVDWMQVTGHDYAGPCSANNQVDIIDGKISGNGYGIIQYRWVIDGVPGAVKEYYHTPDESIHEAGVISKMASQSSMGSAAIEIIKPVQKMSNLATYSITCIEYSMMKDLQIGKLLAAISDLSLEGFEIKEIASGKLALDGTTAGRSRYYPSWTVRNKGQAESAPTMLSVACLGEGGGSQQCPAGLQGNWPVPALAAGGSFTARGDKAVMMPPEGVRLKLTATLAAGGAADNVEPRRLVSFFPEAPLAGGQGLKEPDGSLEIASRHGLDRERGSALTRTIKGAEGGEAAAAGEEEADTKGPGALAPLSLAKRSAGGAAARGLQPMDGKLNLVRAPKVKVQRLWAVPASPKADQPFALHMMLLNQGSEASEPGQRYQLSCGGPRGGPCPLRLEHLMAARPIAPNGTLELKLEQLKAPAGSYRITAAPASGEAGLGAWLNLSVEAPASAALQNLPLRSSATGAAGATSAPADRSSGTARTSRP